MSPPKQNPVSNLMICFGFLGAVGCAGTETGNAYDGPIPISVALRPSTLKLAAVDARGLAIEVTAAEARVRRIDFDLPAGETCATVGHLVEGGVCVLGEAEERFRFTGPWLLDVLADPAPIDGLALPAGDYLRVDIRMQRPEDDLEGGDDLKQAEPMSLILRGTAGAGTFTLHLRDTLDARFEGQAAVVGGQGVVPVRLELPVATWFAGVDLAACVGSGNVVIDDDSDDACEAVYEGVTRAIERAGRLVEDDDDDLDD